MNFETFMHEVSCLKAYRRSLKEIQERISDLVRGPKNRTFKGV